MYGVPGTPCPRNSDSNGERDQQQPQQRPRVLGTPYAIPGVSPYELFMVSPELRGVSPYELCMVSPELCPRNSGTPELRCPRNSGTPTPMANETNSSHSSDQVKVPKMAA